MVLSVLLGLAGFGHVAGAQPVEASTDQGQAVEAKPGQHLPADLETTRAALLLLNDAVTVRADGRHHRLLRALRYLRDPALGELFRGLAEASRHPSIRVHAVLGLAEIREPARLTTAEIASIQEPLVQAELISAALDAGLLDPATRRELLNWPQVDAGLKVMLCLSMADGDGPGADPATQSGNRRKATGQPRAERNEVASEGSGGVTRQLLVDALGSENAGQRGLAALLLQQRGEDAGRAVLDALAGDTSTASETTLQALLETVWRERLDRGAGWAWEVANQADRGVGTQMLALRVALQMGEPAAVAGWQQWSRDSREAGDLSGALRLAMVGLEASPWLSASEVEGGWPSETHPANAGDTDGAEHAAGQFSEDKQAPADDQRADDAAAAAEQPAAGEPEPAVTPTVDALADDGLLAALGAAARAVAGSAGDGGQTAGNVDESMAPEVQAALEDLLQTHYAPAWRWAAEYAERSGSPTLAVALLETYRPDEARGRARRLEAVASASQTLAMHRPQTAARLLPGRLLAEEADPAWSRAVLLGLLRSRSDAGPTLARKIESLDDAAASDLLLILQLRTDQSLREGQLTHLRRLLQHDDRLDETLRVEPAWIYLRDSGQAAAAVRALLAPSAIQVREAQELTPGSVPAGVVPVDTEP